MILLCQTKHTMDTPKKDDLKINLKHKDVNQRMHKIILMDTFATGKIKKKNVPRHVKKHRKISIKVSSANEKECVFPENRKLNVQQVEMLSPIWSVCTRTNSEDSNLQENCCEIPSNEYFEDSFSTICLNSSIKLRPTVVMCTISDDGTKTKEMVDRATSNVVKLGISNAIQTSPYSSVKASDACKYRRNMCGCQYYVMKPEPRVPVCSYTECPSEVLQKITNFDSINCVNKTSKSISPHVIISGSDRYINSDKNNVTLRIDNNSSAAYDVKSPSSKSGNENRHHSSKEMAHVESVKGESDSWSSCIQTDESNGRTLSTEQLLKIFLDSGDWRSKKFKRTPGYRYNLPGFEIISKKISVQCLCRKRLHRTWKKTLQRWACSLGSQGKQGKSRKHNKCNHCPVTLDNVIIQTSVRGCKETGTDSNANQLKSAAFSPIFNKDTVQSFCNQTDGELSGKHSILSPVSLTKSLTKFHSYPPVLFRNNNNIMVNFQWNFKKKTTHTASSALRLDPDPASRVVLEKATSAILFSELKLPQKSSKSISCKSLDKDTKHVNSKNSSHGSAGSSSKYHQKQLEYSDTKDVTSKFSKGPSFLNPVLRFMSEKSTSTPLLSELKPQNETKSVITQNVITCMKREIQVPSQVLFTHATHSTNTSGTNTKVSSDSDRDISKHYDLAQDTCLYNVLDKLVRRILGEQTTEIRNGGSKKTCISTNTSIELDNKALGPCGSICSNKSYCKEMESKEQQCQSRISSMYQQPVLVARSQFMSTLNFNQLNEEESTQIIQENYNYANRRMSMGTSTHFGLDNKAFGKCMSVCKGMKRCQCGGVRKDNIKTICTNTSVISAMVQKPTLVARSQFVNSFIFNQREDDSTKTEQKSYHTVTLPKKGDVEKTSLAETPEKYNSEKVLFLNEGDAVAPSLVEQLGKQNSDKVLEISNGSEFEITSLEETIEQHDSEKGDAEMVSLADTLQQHDSEKAPPASILTQNNLINVLHVRKSNAIMTHLETTNDSVIKEENPTIMVMNQESTSDNNLSKNLEESMTQACPDVSDAATEMVLIYRDQSTSTSQFVLPLHTHCNPPPKINGKLHSIVKMLLTPSSGNLTDCKELGVQERTVHENRSCRPCVKTESLIATKLSSRLLFSGNSLTNICKHDKDGLRSVYFLLSSIEGRMRRLKSNMPKGTVLRRH